MKNFVSFDLETTGFEPHHASIIEIGAVRFDRYGRELGRLSLIIDPGAPIPTVVSDLTHIKDSQVKGGYNQEEAVRMLLKFCGDDYIVGHGVTFDVGFCKAIVPGAFANSIVFDTQKIAQKIVPPAETVPSLELLTQLLVAKKRIPDGTYTLDSLTKELVTAKLIDPGTYTLPELVQTAIDKKLIQRGKYTLENLGQLFGVRHTNPHRAWSDAQATAVLFRRLLKRAGDLDAPEIASFKSDADVQGNDGLKEFFGTLLSAKGHGHDLDVRKTFTRRTTATLRQFLHLRGRAETAAPERVDLNRAPEYAGVA